MKQLVESMQEIFLSRLEVKVGADAVNAGIVDLFWDSSQAVQRSVQLLPLLGYESPADCPCKAFVLQQKALLDSILGAEIFRVPQARPITDVIS